MYLFLALFALSFLTVRAADDAISTYAKWPQRSSNSDLLKFVTRPDLTPPRLKTHTYSKDKAASGYIFVAPYDCLACGKEPTTTYTTQQIGPHIYTTDGELVWSGIDLYYDQKVFDFKAVVVSGAYHLSLIVPPDTEWSNAGGFVLNASYLPVAKYVSPSRVDIHELNLINGSSALMGALAFHEETHEPANWEGSLMDGVFIEYEQGTQEQVFLWKASNHIDLSESTHPSETGKVWDWFHLNSLDKNDDGEYLLSARFTNTIYLLAKDGTVRWRLGGIHSSFKQDFNFSRQHDARFRGRENDQILISFLDNAVDEEGFVEATASSSSLVFATLNLASMTATQRVRIPRPDGGYTKARGNMQVLPNGNILGGWGENAYITEHASPDGELVYEAAFASTRFTNYRAYKMDWVGQPIEAPIAKAFVSTTSHRDLTTTIYVSWNGATEVYMWKCYSRTVHNGVGTAQLVGAAQKTGFETAFVVNGYHDPVFVEAVDVNGKSLMNTSVQATELPLGFHDFNLDQGSALLQPVSESHYMNRTIIAFSTGVACAIICTRLLRLFFPSHRRRSALWR